MELWLPSLKPRVRTRSPHLRPRCACRWMPVTSFPEAGDFSSDSLLAAFSLNANDPASYFDGEQEKMEYKIARGKAR